MSDQPTTLSSDDPPPDRELAHCPDCGERVFHGVVSASSEEALKEFFAERHREHECAE